MTGAPFLLLSFPPDIADTKQYRYEKCDPQNPNYWWGGGPEYALADEGISALESAPALESISAPQAEVASKVDSPESTESSYGM